MNTKFLGALLCVMLAILPGCRSGTVTPGSEASALAPALVPLPPGLDPRAVTPREGDDLLRAGQSLTTVLAGLPRPDYLQPVEDRPATGSIPQTQPDSDRPGEPPLAAQYAYAAARAVWKQGLSDEAIRRLEQARAILPDRPEILRLLGQVYTALGNRPRGAVFLEQAVRLDPTDSESLFLLAAYEFEQNNWAPALHGFARILEDDSALRDPALITLTRYYLGESLRNQGWDQAYIDQATAYLQRQAPFTRTTRYGRELSVLFRRRSDAWMLVGDAHLRLGRLEAGLEAYREAADLDMMDDALGLARRLIYVFLRLRQPALAQQTTIEFLSREGQAIEESSLGLVRYVADYLSDRVQFAAQLHLVYVNAGRPSPMALAIADLLGSVEGRALLLSHLQNSPTDWPVYDRLLTQDLEKKDSRGIAAALRSAAQAIASSPAAADRYALGFRVAAQRAGIEPQAVLDGFTTLTPDEQAGPWTQYLRALYLLDTRATDAAIAALRSALNAQPESEPVRLALARALVAVGQHEQAMETLTPLSASLSSPVVMMRAALLRRNGQSAQALALLDRALSQQPGGPELSVAKAEIQLESGDSLAGERTLLDALAANPGVPAMYAALFDVYERRLVPDSDRQWVKLLRRAMQTIPRARITRLKLADDHRRARQPAQARKVLEGLLNDNAQDYEALDGLLDVMVELGQKDKADEMVAQRLAPASVERPLLMVAVRHYARTRDMPAYHKAAERMLLKDPPGERRARELALIYLRTERPGEAASVLREALAGASLEEPAALMSVLGRALIRSGQGGEVDAAYRQAIERFPKEGVELKFEWAMAMSMQERHDDAEKLLQDVLALDPSHGGANNALGYQWADQGKNLRQAQRMIQIALDAQPRSPAILDSMGWVWYKLGDFETAAKYLTQARNQPGGDDPVILDHLGDTLHRTGAVDEAVQLWKQALAEAEKEDLSDNPETKRVLERVKAKLAAVEAKQPPPLSPVPAPEAAPAPVPAP